MDDNVEEQESAVPDRTTPENQAPIWRRLAALAAPIIGLNVLAVFTLAVDTAMCGHLPNADIALTALGFSTQVVFLLLVAMIGLTVGTVALISRAHGAGDADRVNHVLQQSTQLTMLLGVIIAIGGNLVAPWILRSLGASGPALEAGLDYLRPLLGGTVFYYLNVLYAASLRGVGNTRLPFFVALVYNVLNIALNYGFILGGWGFPALGVFGAAIGTVLSQACGVLLMVTLLRRGVVPKVRVLLKPAPIDRKLAKELWQVGAPAAADMVILNAGFLAVVGLVGRFDQLAVAAHGLGIRIQALAFVPGLAVAQAAGAMIGNALGAQDTHEARRLVRASVIGCASLMSVLGISILLAVDSLIILFEVDPASSIGGYARDWIRILGWGMPVVGVWIGLVGMLQGSGATGTALRINMWSTLGVQIPLCWLLGYPLGLGCFGVWVAFPMAFVVKAWLGIREYRKGTWARPGMRLS